MTTNASYLSRIRGVDLLPGERVGALLSPDDGLMAEPTKDGRLLVATNQRFINLADSGESQVRDLFSIASVSGTSVRNDVVRGFSWKQWVALVAGGLVVYVALAYWLVDRLPQIVIPGLNLHVFALIVMILVIVAGWLFWRGFTQPGGTTMRIHGANWNVELPCSTGYADLMAFAHALSLMQSQHQGTMRLTPVAEGE